jgi:ankyrin repeat protein
MAADQSDLMALIRVVGADDASAMRLLASSPALAAARLAQGATREAATDFYLVPIAHYVYAGDTALHVAAAAYRHEIAKKLIAMGADLRARNRRGAEPLHYAADGTPGAPTWNPPAQAETIAILIAAGADPNAVDNSGVMPLHRAVRTRCAAAVKALLAGGADALAKNKNGSSPMLLATQNTGRSGSPGARVQQIEIVRLLEEAMGAR